MKRGAAIHLQAVVCLLAGAECSALIFEYGEGLKSEPIVTVSALASSDVEYAKGLHNCTKGMLADEPGTCVKVGLLLDIYAPNGTINSTDGTRRPAILIVHGGGNEEGSKTLYSVAESAKFWAKNGYVVFVPNYRLEQANGTYPGEDFNIEISPWHSLYPAVRDVKASLRYIVANAETLNVNASRIAAMGMSAGAMDVLAAFYPHNNSQFTTELSLDQDPTLSTVNADVNATVQAIIMKWGNDWGLESYSQYSGHKPPWKDGGDAYVPVMQFHGTADDLVPFSNAKKARRHFNEAGAQNCLHVMKGKPHSPINYGCPELGETSYCNVVDKMSLAFLQSVEARANGTANGTIVCPSLPSD